MSERMFGDWLKAYMDYSAHSEAPDKFHFWTGVGAIAGALRRHVWINMGYFDWTPNFYIIFVAPPGIISKSTTASIGMNLLRRVDGVKFGPDAVTWQALAKSLAESTEMFQMMDENNEEINLPMSAITIVSSEFGNFLNPHDREMVDMLVSLWDGQVGVFKKATKTMGDDVIENPWVNCLACTTPAWIAGNFPDYMIGGGFTSRCIFVYGDKKRQYVAYPKDHLPTDFKDQSEKLIHDLEHIAVNLVGEYTLSPEAKEWGEQWYLKHYTEGEASNLNNDRFAGYLARKQTHMHKLAMVLTAAKSDELVIHADTLAGANDIITGLEADMPKVFSNIGRSEDARHMDAIVAEVRRAGRIDRVELYRHHFGQVNFGDFSKMLESAIHAGYVRQVQYGKTMMVEATNYTPEILNESNSNAAVS